VIDSDHLWPRGRLLPRFGRHVTVRYGTPFVVAHELERLEPGVARDRRKATEAATRLIMTRIAELLPPRQRGVYAEAARSAPAEQVPGSTGSGPQDGGDDEGAADGAEQ
jgi:hypothetical protein